MDLMTIVSHFFMNAYVSFQVLQKNPALITQKVQGAVSIRSLARKKIAYIKI